MTISSAFANAWSVAVGAYRQGAVNSECTLHSLVYSALRTSVAGSLVLCEPQINVERHGCFVPDIVVVRDRAVVAIAELKFVPHHYPVFELDLQKLTILADYRQDFPLCLDPSTGKFSAERYAIDPGCLLVFGAVGKRDAAAVDEPALRAVMASFASRFLPLVEAVGQ